MARLDPLPPADMTPELRAVHDDMRGMIDKHLKGFVSTGSEQALIGPFAPMLRFPDWGRAAWEYTKSLMEHTSLPKGAHEVAILVTGARFGARYELYAHEHVAAGTDLPAETIATIAAGERPADLPADAAVAYDVAAALTRGGALPESVYRAGVRTFGENGMAELVYLVGGYGMVSVLLNAYDVDVPGADESRSG